MPASLQQLQQQADMIARDAEIFGLGHWTTDAQREAAAARLHRNTEILLAWAHARSCNSGQANK
jgi:hypothetical protein